MLFPHLHVSITSLHELPMHSSVMSRNSSQIMLKTNLVGAPCAHPPHAVSSAAPWEDTEWETEERKAVGNFLLAMHNQLALVVWLLPAMPVCDSPLAIIGSYQY